MVRPTWPVAAVDNPGPYVAQTQAVIEDLQAFANVGALRPVNRMLVTMGDSISDNVNYPGPNSKSWAQRACMLLDGQLQWVRAFGVGGATSTEVIEDQLSDLVAMTPRPGFCTIMMGANDTDEIATFKANYTAAIDAMLAVGIIPICGAVPPNSSSGNHLKAHRYNTWLSRECGRRGIPFINFMEALVDISTSGAYAATYDEDGVHPSVIGAGVMAQRLADTMTAYLSGRNIIDPYLANCNLDPSMLALSGPSGDIRNFLFLNDTNADGAANVWGIQNNGDASAVLSLESGDSDNVIGNWQTMTRGVGDGSDSSRMLNTDGVWGGVLPGDVIQIGYRFKASIEAGSGVIYLGFPHSGGGGSPATDGFSGPQAWTTDIAPTTMGREYIVRADAPNQLFAFFDFVPGEGSLSVGQFTCRNLTTLGVV